MNFIAKKIKEGEKTVGEELQDAREQKGLSLEETAQKLGIKAEYIDHLEHGRHEKLHGGVYEKIYLKKYTRFLGINYKKIEERFKIEKSLSARDEKKDVFSKKRISGYSFFILPKIIKNILITMVISSFFIYLGFYLKLSFSSPKIEITEPADNLVIENNFVYIIGKTGTSIEITINNKPALKNDLGEFSEKIDLKNGMNNIIIIGKNKYNKKTIIEKQVLVK